LRVEFGLTDRVAQVARDRLAALRPRYPTTPLRSRPRLTPTH